MDGEGQDDDEQKKGRAQRGPQLPDPNLERPKRGSHPGRHIKNGIQELRRLIINHHHPLSVSTDPHVSPFSQVEVNTTQQGPP